MTILVTGAAGFIGYHTSLRLLARGERVLGVDCLSPYYDVRLKQTRLEHLRKHEGFSFVQADIADRAAMQQVATSNPEVTDYINLAAQAGVRHSLTAPFDYTHSNIEGHLVMLEMARANPKCRHFVYASSSSVYGANTKLPFSVEDRVDTPISLYAASKRSGELMSHSYSHLFRVPTTGLRFFTVYGPWGRPDMAAYLFADAIIAGQPIKVFNNGDMRRDFTYIDDIVSGVVGVLDNPPADDGKAPPYRLYNIGNNNSEKLMDFIGLVESSLGRKATYDFHPMQPGDVKETYADISAIQRDVGFAPATPISVGVPRFIEWYKQYHRL
ncbi:NAD-dependent epimerase/dehydratase family protein [Paramagnetospirillum magneticum]|uniref:Nucleoside-diphosphate-sugar epimerase n=1 Tax=Paramagnetospirillum magneticum (strain ATCC 700264 / AMB-1) TaxID=342108 RepID=Q2W5B2_PARM1|nr:NAD-dependent epimerase/dehydratase family protein [Paramagnetospirillum magneticum]BAE50963.1 Nucleoside-diphosphate-sugar epimerase [Paramagnetospirillum magneticum AMB-1]